MTLSGSEREYAREMKKKVAEPKPLQQTPGAADAPKTVAKPARKPPINPFTSDKGRALGRAGRSGPSRTAWKT